MQIPENIVTMLLTASGRTWKPDNARIGIRKVEAVWFNFATGHFVARTSSVFMWSNGPNGPWDVVSGTAPCERRAA